MKMACVSSYVRPLLFCMWLNYVLMTFDIYFIEYNHVDLMLHDFAC